MQTIQNIAEDVQAVITSYNQGEMVREAVDSLCNQTMLPSKIIIVDDGSTDEASIQILKEIQSDSEIPIPVCIVRQENSGVSAARNAGIRRTETAMVLVVDGDDRLEPEYIEKVRECMQKDPSMIAASSWMHTFGILESVSMNRLYGWESEICNTLTQDQKLSDASDEFMRSPSYGDGGMAAAVRIATMQKKILE